MASTVPLGCCVITREGGIQRGDEGYKEDNARGGRAIKKGMARDRERGARGEGRARGGCLKDGARVDDGAIEIVVRRDGDRVLSPVHLGVERSTALSQRLNLETCSFSRK